MHLDPVAIWIAFSLALLALGGIGAKKLLIAGSLTLVVAYVCIALQVHNEARQSGEGNEGAVALLTVGLGFWATVGPITFAWLTYGLNRIVRDVVRQRKLNQEIQ